MLIRKILKCKAASQLAAPFATDAKSLKIGVPKEVYPNERRVSITPDTIEKMVKKHGCSFVVESGAG